MTGRLLKVLGREARGARGLYVFFVLCLALGIGAIVGVRSLVGAVQEDMTERSRALTAADFSVSARRPIPDEILAPLAAAEDITMTRLREQATMAQRVHADGDGPGRSRLVQAITVAGRYPLYGELELRPRGRLSDTLDAHSVVIEPDLARALDVQVGDEIAIGGASFRVAAIIVAAPPRLGFSMMLGPRVFLHQDGYARAPGLALAARAESRALFAVDGGANAARLQELRTQFEQANGDLPWLRFRTHTEDQPRVARVLDRIANFLALVALLSLLLGGLGVAQAVRLWVARTVRTLGLLRCLGVGPCALFKASVLQVLLMALLACVLGVTLGASVPFVVELLAPEILDGTEVQAFQPQAWAEGALVGLLVALAFALPPLTALYRVPPARVLREEAAPLPVPRLMRLSSALVLVGGLLGAAIWQAGDVRVGLGFAAIIGGLLAVAALCAYGAVQLGRRLPRARLGAGPGHALAALGRPGAGTVAAISGLALGILVVGALGVIQSRLIETFESLLPESAPSAFFLDIQSAQWPEVAAVLEEHGAEHIEADPMMTGRLVAVNGRTVAEMLEESGEGRRGRHRLTREQRLSARETLRPSNTLTEGELWHLPEVHELSLEEEFARDLGVGVGDQVDFEIAGVPFTFTVTSLRQVDWLSLDINFFILAEPSAFADAPTSLLAVAKLPEGKEATIQDALVAVAPNVTVIQTGPIRDQLLSLVTTSVGVVRHLSTVTIVAGLLVLGGVLAAGSLRKRREAALWKTLGVSRGRVTRLFFTEFALLGFVAGLVGGAGALFLADGFMNHVLERGVPMPFWLIPVLAFGTALAAGGLGLLVTRRALVVPPIESLRA